MGVTSSRCQNCGAALAADQRYCLSCGERRGKARFSLANLAPAAPAVQTVGARRTVVSSGPWGASSAMASLLFVGFIILVLAALSVGVLIGHNSTTTVAQRSATPQITVLNSGGGSGTPAFSSSSAGTPASSSASSNSTPQNTKAVSKAPVTKKVAAKAQAAASKVIGGKNLPPATVKVGQKGSGAGYQNGQFTGNFFGGN